MPNPHLLFILRYNKLLKSARRNALTLSYQERSRWADNNKNAPATEILTTKNVKQIGNANIKASYSSFISQKCLTRHFYSQTPRM